MPELPEVETTARGIRPHVAGQTVSKVIVRNPKLRWPVPENLAERLTQQRIQSIERRGKYLLFKTQHGHQLLHLGMSGSLRVLPADTAAGKHDHIDWQLESGQLLRLNDPRRFGSVLWTEETPEQHPLLASLGPEPLGEHFHDDYLWQKSRGRKQNVKTFIMDSKLVVGVGNIYASESLFLAGIRPTTQAGRVSKARYVALTQAIKQTLAKAIDAGGTTLKDFNQVDGKPGYFKQELNVYGRAAEPCTTCGTPISNKVLNQRMTYWCPSCQK
ncbi:MAG: bifunctional DNA-formamidopyrimidine glycosylase/DNA-(apurinic or apyrimidinic site) lyase [Gammaproteobacteria bacterium]|nr:bifunctional DNA-formamidopyrimidine glycosylase/DNA-(apurinic or apyrimidinic site) lyase [Gammaproteobacteria bacterium]